MTSRKRKQKHSGVTMLEVLVAGLVLVTSVIALVQFMYVNFTLTGRAQDLSTGYSMARTAIESVRQQGFTNAAERHFHGLLRQGTPPIPQARVKQGAQYTRALHL